MMRSMRSVLPCLLAGSLLVTYTSGVSAQVTKKLLENFTGDRYLDTSVWIPTSPGWGDGIQEVNRELSRAKVNLQIRTTSVVNARDEDDQLYRRNRLRINPDLLEGMVGLEAEIVVNSSEVTGCPIPGSSSTEETQSYVRAMMQSAMMNDGSSTGGVPVRAIFLVTTLLILGWKKQTVVGHQQGLWMSSHG